MGRLLFVCVCQWVCVFTCVCFMYDRLSGLFVSDCEVVYGLVVLVCSFLCVGLRVHMYICVCVCL